MKLKLLPVKSDQVSHGDARSLYVKPTIKDGGQNPPTMETGNW
ncbi:MAG: hypothetical protein WBB28_07650 [Crinalium sp.]